MTAKLLLIQERQYTIELFISAVPSPASRLINILVADLAFAHLFAKNETLACVELKDRGNNHSF